MAIKDVKLLECWQICCKLLTCQAFDYHLWEDKDKIRCYLHEQDYWLHLDVGGRPGVIQFRRIYTPKPQPTTKAVEPETKESTTNLETTESMVTSTELSHNMIESSTELSLSTHDTTVTTEGLTQTTANTETIDTTTWESGVSTPSTVETTTEINEVTTSQTISTPLVSLVLETTTGEKNLRYSETSICSVIV